MLAHEAAPRCGQAGRLRCASLYQPVAVDRQKQAKIKPRVALDARLKAAGNNLTLEAGRSSETLDEASTRTGKDKSLFGSSKTTLTTSRQAASSTAEVTTLVGNNVSLSAGSTLASEGAQVRASEELALKAQTIVLDAAYDYKQSNSSANTLSKTKPREQGTDHGFTHLLVENRGLSPIIVAIYSGKDDNGNDMMWTARRTGKDYILMPVKYWNTTPIDYFRFQIPNK